MRRGYIAIEGHGEVKSIHNLVNRLWMGLQLTQLVWASPAMRACAINTKAGLFKICELARGKRDAAALLIVRDADDDEDCPRRKGPETAAWARELALPFPVAIVLLRREFETLFLPCLARMAGQPLRDDRGIERPGLLPGTVYPNLEDLEGTRGVKEWLSRHFPPGRSYEPTLDQLPMTRMIDFDDLRRSGLPSFGTLERALRFLGSPRGRSLVHPTPPDTVASRPPD